MTEKLLVAVSGGADSTAMALLLHERGEDFELLFSDTGAELPEVYWLLPRLARYVGKPLHVVSGGGFFLWLNHYGFMLPGPRVRWCTRVLKQQPQDDFATKREFPAVAVGIRADEQRRLERPTRPRPGGKHEFCYPLAEAGLGKREVRSLCESHDLLNPVYAWRTNVSCFCCFFQRKTDWLGLLKHHPTLYAVAEEWEAASASASQRHGGTGFSWAQRYSLTSLRTADERQLRLWEEDEDEEPCLICRA